jgi:hypothetical protein
VTCNRPALAAAMIYLAARASPRHPSSPSPVHRLCNPGSTKNSLESRCCRSRCNAAPGRAGGSSPSRLVGSWRAQHRSRYSPIASPVDRTRSVVAGTRDDFGSMR